MRVKYIGEKNRAMVKKPGIVTSIRCKCKDGIKLEFKAADKVRGHLANDIIDLGPVDARVARHMAADPRFQVIP